MSNRHERAMDDAQSAETLFRLHASFVRRFVIRLGVRPEDAGDVVQEVFLVAHRRGGYVPGPARPTTWLGEIALRVTMAARRASRRSTDQGMPPDVASEAPSPYDVVSAAQSLSLLQRSLDALDLRDRAVFVLFELEDESCDSIAHALGVPVGTIYSRLHHARRALRKAYERLDKRGDFAAARAEGT